MSMGMIKALYRILALVGKELIETFRRPGAVLWPEQTLQGILLSAEALPS